MKLMNPRKYFAMTWGSEVRNIEENRMSTTGFSGFKESLDYLMISVNFVCGSMHLFGQVWTWGLTAWDCFDMNVEFKV